MYCWRKKCHLYYAMFIRVAFHLGYFFCILISFLPFLRTIYHIWRYVSVQILAGKTSTYKYRNIWYTAILFPLFHIWNIQGVFVYSHAYCTTWSYMINYIFFSLRLFFCRRSTTTIPTVPSGITRSAAWWDTGLLRAANFWKPTRATPLAPAVTWPTSPSSWLIGEMW